jgi:Tfp pilus assembly protein PilF
VSRLLDNLRRQRRSDGPPVGGEDRSAADSARQSTAASRAVVLDALSGGGRVVPWYRRHVPAILGVLGAAAVLLYMTVMPGRSNPDQPALRTRITPATIAGVRPSDTGLQKSRSAARSPEMPGSAPVRASAPEQPASRQPPSAAHEAAPIAPPDRRAAGDAHAAPVAATRTAGGAVSPDDERLVRALHYQQSGDIENAIREYRALLEADDSKAQAHNNLGLLYQGKGLLEEANREFRRAIAIDPAYDTARNNLGVGLMRAGNVEAAAAQFRRILAGRPANQEALINLALSQRAGGHADEARETLIRAIEVNEGNAVAHYNLALLYEDAGQIVRALDHYETYLKYAAGSDAAHVAAVRDHCQVLRQRLIPR